MVADKSDLKLNLDKKDVDFKAQSLIADVDFKALGLISNVDFRAQSLNQLILIIKVNIKTSLVIV